MAKSSGVAALAFVLGSVTAASHESSCIPPVPQHYCLVLPEQQAACKCILGHRIACRSGFQSGNSQFVDMLFAAGSGQPQAQRFNQPISFVSSGTVGTDPMEIRPALQQAASTPAPTTADTSASHLSTAVAATAGLPADDTAMRRASSGAQLQDALQAAEPSQASVSMQSGERQPLCCDELMSAVMRS